MNENKRTLRRIELWLAKNRQAEAECNTAEANVRKAEAALQKFRTKQPHEKKKSGRPGFWKSPHGLFFVQEVDRVRKKRNGKIASAIRIVRTKTFQRSRWCQARGLRDPIIEQRAARLMRLSGPALQVRYQEARRYWMFLIAPELHQKEEESLKRNFDEALSAWGAASTAWRKLGEACPNITLTRNPYDFS
jgi:hypothetical protein